MGSRYLQSHDFLSDPKRLSERDRVGIGIVIFKRHQGGILVTIMCPEANGCHSTAIELLGPAVVPTSVLQKDPLFKASHLSKAFPFESQARSQMGVIRITVITRAKLQH